MMPIFPKPEPDSPEAGVPTSGEGAQTALAAMIRKRKMGENHIEQEQAEKLPAQAGPDI